MNETWQMVIVILIVALSIGLAARHYYRIYTRKESCCEGCEGCALKEKCENCGKRNEECGKRKEE